MIKTTRTFLNAAVLCTAAALLGCAGNAFAADSGQRNFAQVSVEPAIDATNGQTIYLLTPEKAPVPVNANDTAIAPLYLPLYPLSSTVSTFDLNCLPTNCEHVNVLPFHFAGYDPLAANSKACVDFNGGQECALVKGHDHLVGVSPSGGKSQAACHVQLVVFTAKAFADGAINNRVKTVNQVAALLANDEAILINTPITLHCSVAAERTYQLGTPVVVPFP